MTRHTKIKPSINLLRNSVLAILSAIVLAIISYYWLDLPIAGYFYLHPHPLLAQISCLYLKKMFAGSVWLFIGVVSLLLAGLMHVLKKPAMARALFFFAAVNFTSDVITEVLKIILARYRPEVFFDTNRYGFHFFSTQWLYNSMPSGHATVAFANFMAIAVLIKRAWLTISLVLLAIVVALSRLVCYEHYLGDVIIGAYVGLLSVYWVQAFFVRFVPARS